MRALAQHVMDLQNVVVILFCLCCGSEDIFENGSGWIWGKRTACFHALFWRSGRVPALLMWSRSDLMTITVVRFGSAALSRELLPILCLVQKMFPIMFLLPLSFSRQIIRYRPSGGPQAVLTGSYTNPLSVHQPFSFISVSLFLPLSLFLSLSPSIYIKMLRSRGELALELSLHTTRFRFQISQDILCTHEFINTEFEPCLPSSIRVTS